MKTKSFQLIRQILLNDSGKTAHRPITTSGIDRKSDGPIIDTDPLKSIHNKHKIVQDNKTISITKDDRKCRGPII